MFKLLLPFLSFFAGNAKNFFQDSSEVVMRELALHLRSLVFLISIALGSLVLSCVGISMFFVSLANQLEAEQGFYFSPSMILFAVMSLLALAGVIYSLRRKTWVQELTAEKDQAEKSKVETKSSGALENAVALLVMDFIEERQKKRENSQSSPPL